MITLEKRMMDMCEGCRLLNPECFCVDEQNGDKKVVVTCVNDRVCYNAMFLCRKNASPVSKSEYVEGYHTGIHDCIHELNSRLTDAIYQKDTASMRKFMNDVARDIACTKEV